jgi:hypothetical protein
MKHNEMHNRSEKCFPAQSNTMKFWNSNITKKWSTQPKDSFHDATYTPLSNPKQNTLKKMTSKTG